MCVDEWYVKNLYTQDAGILHSEIKLEKPRNDKSNAFSELICLEAQKKYIKKRIIGKVVFLIKLSLSFMSYQFGSFHSQPEQLTDYRVVLVNSECGHTACK